MMCSVTAGSHDLAAVEQQDPPFLGLADDIVRISRNGKQTILSDGSAELRQLFAFGHKSVHNIHAHRGFPVFAFSEIYGVLLPIESYDVYLDTVLPELTV